MNTEQPNAPDEKPHRNSPWAKLAGGLAIAFGIATLIEGGKVVFGDPAARAEAGNIVWFVLLFNFSAGFVYVLGGLATLAGHSAAIWIARALAISTLGVLVAFAVHVLQGGAYAPRTVVAISLRSAFWVAQALALPKLLTAARTS